LSTLTKILIVLLSLFSIFLCGTVVTYVGTAKNYKSAYENLNSELTALKKKTTNYEQQLEEKKRQMEELAGKLDTEIAKLKTEKSQIEQELKDAARSKTALDEKVQSLAAAALGFEETVGGMEDSLKTTRQELDKARAEGIKLAKNLNEITASLEEKIAQLNAVDAEKRRLLEQQTSGGPGAEVSSEPVTPLPDDSATRIVETPVSTALQGTVTAVDGSLVTLSIGDADGVVKGMVFHVIRNDNFVCDIRITEVDMEASAGASQLVQEQPRVGDIASTMW
jgi:ABC-type transporter Mla subunit MlaD